jgi:Mannosyltransferase OCH1 and related enzymes
MIPKTIHYCWFGKGSMPQSQKQCIESWKRVMPDYKIMRWDESSFDYNKYSASKYAYQVKKYALVSDLCRYNVLAEYGGIYLDTDVEVFKRFDDFLNADFFSAIELYHEFETENSAAILDEHGCPLVPGTDIPHLEMLTSTIGCVPNCNLICELRDYYNSIQVDEEYANNYRKYVNNDRLVARMAVKYGFRYIDKEQHLENNMVIYPTGIFGHAFCPNKNYTVSYHYNAASWLPKRPKKKINIWLERLHLLKVKRFMKKMLKKIWHFFENE